jgi:hypothetical protein
LIDEPLPRKYVFQSHVFWGPEDSGRAIGDHGGSRGTLLGKEIVSTLILTLVLIFFNFNFNL